MSGVPPLAVSSSGNFIFDSKGNSIFDACGGAAVSAVGHAHPRVLEAMHRQIDTLAYAHSSFFTSEPAEKLADFLTANCPGDMSHAYFTSGGSESVETALKLARQYFVEIGQPGRSKFIARFQSYHGNTLGALGVGGSMWRRKMYDPLLVEGHHVSPCYAYRGLKSCESLEQYTDRLISEAEAMIFALGPEKVAGFVAEPVVGATLGAVCATPSYFARLREICDRYGILLILDEVMCGMGRTGTLFAFEQEGIVPDIVTIAKGLGGGYAPIGAVMIRSSIADAIRGGSGAFMHGHTYNGHPLACAAAMAVQEVIHDEEMLANVKSTGKYLQDQISARLAGNNCVGDVRGRGLFVGVEFVSDKHNKTPFDAEIKFHARVRQAALARGLAIYNMGGTVDGRSGDHLLVAPAYSIGKAEADLIVDRLVSAIDTAQQEIAAHA
jgi:adenosylmethionine-8-amino-7-oxononanoate aminotransferase